MSSDVYHLVSFCPQWFSR